MYVTKDLQWCTERELGRMVYWSCGRVGDGSFLAVAQSLSGGVQSSGGGGAGVLLALLGWSSGRFGNGRHFRVGEDGGGVGCDCACACDCECDFE